MDTSHGTYDSKSPANAGAGARVSDDVSKLKNDIANLADSVRNLAGEKVGTTAEEVQATAKEKLGELEAMVRKNPTQSALVAAGVGFLIGLVLTR